MLTLLIFSCLKISRLVFLAQYACIVMDIVLEDGLSLHQVQRHESVRIFRSHLRIERMHWLVFNQCGHSLRHILQCLRVRGSI